MRILDAEAMHDVDRAAIEEYGIPGLVLMENAAIGLADAIAETYPQATSATIFCGPGNNGGDGLALARHLTVRGYHIESFLLTGGRSLGGDALVQHGICQSQGIALREIGPEDELHSALETARGLDIVIDALLGIGLKRPLEGQFATLVTSLNKLRVPRIAIDLPSGLSGSRSDIPGPHLEADLTVTFGAPKVSHVFSPAAETVGEVVVADLGVPTELVEKAAGGMHLIVGEELAPQLLVRPKSSHKGDYGHVLVLAGSEGKAGASILAARAAIKSGAGLVTVAAPRSIVQTVDLGSLESMTLALGEDESGALRIEDVPSILDFSADKQVLAVGPGVGTKPGTQEVIRSVALGSELPLVLDADGLNAFASDIDLLAGRKAETILTPHPGELARLLDCSTTEIQSDRIGAARRAAARSGAWVVLKGSQSLVCESSGDVFVNSTGNPGMATGGTGDVLTGMIASYLGQGYEPLVAAQLGVYLHGAAGDLAAEEEGFSGLSATDLLRHLSGATQRLGAL